MNQEINILLVEDDDVDALNLKRAFKKCNITNPLFIAKNGLEALDMLNGTNGKQQIDPLPAVVLLDLNMPKMNGIEFLEKVREDERLKSLNIFVMTTSNDVSDRMQAYNFNVAGYVVKPVDFEKFVEAMQTLKAYWKLVELPVS